MAKVIGSNGKIVRVNGQLAKVETGMNGEMRELTFSSATTSVVFNNINKPKSFLLTKIDGTSSYYVITQVFAMIGDIYIPSTGSITMRAIRDFGGVITSGVICNYNESNKVFTITLNGYNLNGNYKCYFMYE